MRARCITAFVYIDASSIVFRQTISRITTAPWTFVLGILTILRARRTHGRTGCSHFRTGYIVLRQYLSRWATAYEGTLGIGATMGTG